MAPHTAFVGLLAVLSAILGLLPVSRTKAEDRLSGALELRGGMIVHRGKRLSVDMQRLLIIPDLEVGALIPRHVAMKRVMRLHIAPIIGITRARVTLHERISRNVSTKKLKARITEATDESPRTLNVPTDGINAPPGLLPPTIAFPLGKPGDPGDDIPDRVQIDMPFSAEIDLPWMPTVGFRTSLDVLPTSRWRFEPYAEYQRSLGAPEATLRSIAIDAGGVGVDMAFLRTSVTMHNRWTMFTGGLRLGYRYTYVRPYIDLGVLRIRDSYDIRLRGELEREIRESGVRPSVKRTEIRNEPFYCVGAEIVLGPRLLLRTEAALIASPNSSTIFLNAGFIFPLGSL